MAGIVDCLVVGGGPAGLTAAIYAARFHLSVVVVDAGDSRAAKIPCTRNHAGFPDGISGEALLARMGAQAAKFGADIRRGEVLDLQSADGLFVARLAAGELTARTVLLATGVTNRQPPMPTELHAKALEAGRIRYCPVCDGYEATDQALAVIGDDTHGLKEALFLRSFSARVTLVTPGPDDGLDDAARAVLREAGIGLVKGPIADFQLTDAGLGLVTPAGTSVFDAVYPALGSDVHSALATGLGAAVTDDGCIKVDAHQRTSVAGLYAAGDVVIGLDQISHAMGEAGVAATTIRNDLAARRPRLRPPA